MCPLRIILLFISATLAGFLAWKSLRSSSTEVDDLITGHSKNEISKKKEDFSFRKMVAEAFAVFVDMASGRYLWRNLTNNNNKKKMDDDKNDNGRRTPAVCPFQHLLSIKKKNAKDGICQSENACPFASQFKALKTT